MVNREQVERVDEGVATLPGKALPDEALMKKMLTLDKLRAAIPKEAFEKSLLKSSWFLVFDYAMWFAFTYVLHVTSNSALYASFPAPLRYAVTGVLWATIGFFMWGIFVVGHDCGHNNFSNYTQLNDVLGNLLHASIMVPYWPWRLSHRRHHMHHNHQTKDYSHAWLTDEDKDEDLTPNMKWVRDNPAFRVTMPFFGWWMYLLGVPDGNHWFPNAAGRLWKDTATHEYYKCFASVSIVAAAAYTLYFHVFEQNLTNLAYYYVGPLAFCGWWLVCVTYLQHHSHETVVYDDSNWSFVLAAFETVDRKFGYGIDYLHHHITDGHVAHHLFFTQIPHYNLPIATEGIRKYLADNGMSSLYQLDQTQDFPIRLHKYFYQIGFMAKKSHYAPAGSSESGKKAQ